MKPVFVLIKCQLGQAYTVAGEIVDRIEQVAEVHSISGQYDLLAKFHIGAEDDIGHFVNEVVQRIDGIVDTFTIVTFKAF